MSLERATARRRPSDLLQNAVSAQVPERVVDLLEPVEVDHHHREVAPGAARGPQRVLNAVVEEAAIRKARQRVVQGLVLDLDHLMALQGLALVEGSLGLAAVGDVDHVALHVQRRSRLVVDEHGGVMDPHGAAVARGQAIFAVERSAALVHRCECRQHPLAIVRIQQVAEKIRVGHPFRRRVSDQVCNLRADVHGAAGVQPLDIRDERQLFDEPPVAQLGLRETVLRQLRSVMSRPKPTIRTGRPSPSVTTLATTLRH